MNELFRVRGSLEDEDSYYNHQGTREMAYRPKSPTVLSILMMSGVIDRWPLTEVDGLKPLVIVS